MMSPKIMGTIALFAAAASSADAGALPTGVCYSPWHHGAVNSDVIQKDFAQVKTYFSGVRTYHAQFAGVNAIDEAAKAGVKISVGIQMGNAADIQKELDAACVGAKSNPGSVEAIYVGNENLKNKDFGTFSGSQLAGYIAQLRTCISNSNIKIGSVQRINEWINAADAEALAAASDVIGVNIYPFFTPGDKSPIDKLKDQWNEINTKYPGGKVHVTETGWPRGGATQVAGNSPSKETASSFLHDYAQWAKSQPTSYWFMMYDTKGNQPDYENFFGLADTSGVVQLTIPSGDGAAPITQSPVTQAPTAPVTQAPTAPVTQAPTAPVTQAPTAPVTQAPTAPVTQAPTNPATKAPIAPVTPGAPATQAPVVPAPGTQAPSNPATKAPIAPVTPATQTPANPATKAPVAPVVTPAATSTGTNGKSKKVDCAA